MRNNVDKLINCLEVQAVCSVLYIDKFIHLISIYLELLVEEVVC